MYTTLRVMHMSNDEIVSIGVQTVDSNVKAASGSLVLSKHAFCASGMQARKRSSSSSVMKVSAKAFSTRFSNPDVAVNHRAPITHNTKAIKKRGKNTLTVIQSFSHLLMCVIKKFS